MISRKNVQALGALTLAANLLASAALADATPATNTVAPPPAPGGAVTSTDVSTVAKNGFLDKLTMTYIGQYIGAPIENISGATTPYGGKHRIESTLNTFYKLNTSGLSTGLAVPFIYTPVKGNDMTLADPQIRVNHGKLIQSGNFTAGGDIRLALPLSTNSRDFSNTNGKGAGRYTYLRSIQIVNYDVPGTKLSVGTLSSARWLVWARPTFEANAAANAADPTNHAPDMDFSMVPNVSYQLLPTVALQAGFEWDAIHECGKSLTDMTGDGTSGFVGAAWDITKSINFNPYFDLRKGSVRKDAVSLGAYLTAKIL